MRFGFGVHHGFDHAGGDEGETAGVTVWVENLEEKRGRNGRREEEEGGGEEGGRGD